MSTDNLVTDQKTLRPVSPVADLNLDPAYARWLAWYHSDDAYPEGEFGEAWPDRDDDESRDHYIVRCDVPELRDEVDRLNLLIMDYQTRPDYERGYVDGRNTSAAETQRLRAQVERLRSALERTEGNFVSAVNNRPVRDMAENLAEHAAALAGDDA